MTRNLEVMIDSVKLGLNENHSRSGLTGGRCGKIRSLYQIRKNFI